MCKEVIYSQNLDFRQKNNGIDHDSIKFGKITK